MYARSYTFLQFLGGAELTELVIFLTYILICTALFKMRFSKRATAFGFAAAGAVIAAVNVLIMFSDTDNSSLMLTLIPLTSYLPFSVLLFFFSDNTAFETATVCSIGALGVLVLQSLNKIFMMYSITDEGQLSRSITVNALIVIAAAGLVFSAFRFIGKPFRFCMEELRSNSRNRSSLVLAVPVVLVYLMMIYVLNSTANAFVIVFTMMIALSIFFIIAKLLNSTAELIRIKRSEKEMSEYIELQRRGYENVVRKMETTREYRHDMRHHLAIIQGLIKQSEDEKALEYISKLGGSFGTADNTRFCANVEINAVMSEYIGRAESIGCAVTQSLALPASIAFEANDICLVLANAVENAINACAKLPEEDRRINIHAAYEDGRRLLITVENPCGGDIEFGEDGLPVSGKRSEEHGIGLRSVKRVTEKYNGFMRCSIADGEFVFQAALFFDSGSVKRESVKPSALPKRAVSSVLGLGIGTVLALNLIPSAADAASTLLSIDIPTIRSLNFGWGDNHISIESPEFSGNDADKLNSKVKSYTDEAKKKFFWYFNRRYNGYVAEDMKYTVIRDDEKYYIVQFFVTVNVGGSMDYSRWIVYDKSTEKVLELSDLFKEGSDYINVLSTEIHDQMIYKNAHEGANFFVEGEEAFTEIAEDANFYIDSFDRVVIVFDKYEVAPGSMGIPEFYINNKIVKDILR